MEKEQLLTFEEFTEKVNTDVDDNREKGLYAYIGNNGYNLFTSIEKEFGVASVVERYYGLSIKDTDNTEALQHFLKTSYEVYKELIEHSNLYTAETDYDEDDEDDD